jgi:hypothetical protein
MPAGGYGKNVFINCPFDSAYAPLFEAIVFTVHDAGFRAKCARERLDSSEVRLQKILDLISGSQFSIHDLSRTELDEASLLPRFNMPLELGIDLGCKAWYRSDKKLLIFDSEQYRFQKYISDIAGQDIYAHGNDPEIAIRRVRDWLRAESGVGAIASGSTIFKRYETFRTALPQICSELNLDISQLTFTDFSFAIARWLKNRT